MTKRSLLSRVNEGRKSPFTSWTSVLGAVIGVMIAHVLRGFCYAVGAIEAIKLFYK